MLLREMLAISWYAKFGARATSARKIRGGLRRGSALQRAGHHPLDHALLTERVGDDQRQRGEHEDRQHRGYVRRVLPHEVPDRERQRTVFGRRGEHVREDELVPQTNAVEDRHSGEPRCRKREKNPPEDAERTTAVELRRD